MSEVFSNCGTCPVKEAQSDYKVLCAQFLDERMGNSNPYSIDYLIETVNQIATLSNTTNGTGDDWTLTTYQLVNIYRNEKHTADRYDDWNSKQRTA